MTPPLPWDNVVDGNGQVGIIVYLSEHALIAQNVARHNGVMGFALNLSNSNILRGNRATDNGDAGFDAFLSHGNGLYGNVASNNTNGGFQIAGSSGNRYEANTANGNGTVGFDAFFDSSANVLVNNQAHANAESDARDAGTGKSGIRTTSARRPASNGRVGGRIQRPPSIQEWPTWRLR
jgi:parallel beta-helix repeat protein